MRSSTISTDDRPAVSSRGSTTNSRCSNAAALAWMTRSNCSVGCGWISRLHDFGHELSTPISCGDHGKSHRTQIFGYPPKSLLRKSCLNGIEIFFRIWKAGCRVEAPQLGTLERLERALVIYLMIPGASCIWSRGAGTARIRPLPWCSILRNGGRPGSSPTRPNHPESHHH